MEKIQELNTELPEIKIWNNQRVVTLSDVDKVHKRPEGTAKKNFQNNKKHFILNEDYFELTRGELREKFSPNSQPLKGNSKIKTYLFSESGYLMLAKSFTDDLSWKVQRALVNGYFKAKEERHIATVGMNEETVEQILSFMQEQSEINKKIMNRLETSENRNENNAYENFYRNCIGKESKVEKRKKELYKLTAKLAGIFKISNITVLHYMYRAIEEKLGVTLDAYKAVYISETGNAYAGMVDVIAAYDRLYENAVDLNKYILERI